MEAIESPRIDKYFNVTSELRHVLNSSAAQNPRGLRLEITVTVEYGEKSLKFQDKAGKYHAQVQPDPHTETHHVSKQQEPVM